MDLPLYFPTDYNRRLAGLVEPNRKKFNIVFQDFGRYGHVDVSFPTPESESSQSSEPEYTSQRQHSKQRDRSVLCALTPTLPLSDTPVKVHYPFHDGVIADLPHLPGKVTKFNRALKRVSALWKPGISWYDWFLETKKLLDSCPDSDSPDTDQTSSAQLDSLMGEMPLSVRQLTEMYTYLSQRSMLHGYNPHYSGGVLSCLTDDDGDGSSHLLLHARGGELNRLTATRATPSDSPLVASQVLAESTVGAMFQVDAASVHDGVYIATRHADSCAMFGLSGGEFQRLGSYQCDDRTRPTSVCVSPYLPGESLFSTQGGTVHIWTVDRGVQHTVQRAPRFECRDSWCHGYYASHPRQVVMVDRTAVQMMDSRDRFHSSVDLFALPSRLVSDQECIMAAHHHGNDSPLHAVATSHCVFLVDQRFAGTPVMQWYPDLQGPVQYLASSDCATEGGVRKGVVLAGSQHPAEVMCYPISHGSQHPVVMPMNPWRVSKMSDISTESYTCFNTSNPLLFRQRLNLSLAGVAVKPGSRPSSLVMYQADCYGELYFQQYGSSQNHRTASKTGVPCPGRGEDMFVPAEVQTHVRSWLQHLDAVLEESLRPKKRKRGHPFGVVIRNVRHWMHSGSPSVAEDCPDGGGGGGGRASGGLSFLDGVVPPVDSYEPDAFTGVHLALLRTDEQPLETVEKREEHRSVLLDSWKEKNRKRQKQKTQTQAAEKELSPVHSDDESSPWAEHSVFNSLEHQQENTMIEEILSKTAKPSLPTTICEDVADGAVAPRSDNENTPPDDNTGDESCDLFEDSGQEALMEKSQHFSQDADDDDFFSSQDMFTSFSFSLNQSTLG